MRPMTYELPWPADLTQRGNVIEFNTGRQYTEFGQRIRINAGHPLGIAFADIDRGVTGYIPYFGKGTPREVAGFTLISYDLGNYTHDHTGMAAEMMRMEAVQ